MNWPSGVDQGILKIAAYHSRGIDAKEHELCLGFLSRTLPELFVWDEQTRIGGKMKKKKEYIVDLSS